MKGNDRAETYGENRAASARGRGFIEGGGEVKTLKGHGEMVTRLFIHAALICYLLFIPCSYECSRYHVL